MQADTTTKFGQISTQLNGTQTDLNATKADLEATKGAMSSMKGDLGVQSGLIARNHDEVEELKRLGERDIFEFNLSKSAKAPEHVGPIQMQLKKTDTKKYKYTVNVVADDKNDRKEGPNDGRADPVLRPRRAGAVRDRRVRRDQGFGEGLFERAEVRDGSSARRDAAG